MDRDELEYEFRKLEIEKIVDLFLKLRNINSKLAERLELVETQLDELTDFDTLLESIKWNKRWYWYEKMIKILNYSYFIGLDK